MVGAFGDDHAGGTGAGSAYVFVDLPRAGGPADLNCDGRVDASDVQPFVQALIEPVAYQFNYSYCDLNNADVTGGGCVDGQNIGPSVQAVLN